MSRLCACWQKGLAFNQMEIVAPKDNTYLIGHEKAESLFLNILKSKTLPHAFLISGVEGIGKATFAYRVARFLLGYDEEKLKDYTSLDVSPQSVVSAQISSGSNPNFKVIERGYIEDDEKKIIKAIKDGQAISDEELQGFKKSAVIKVDEVRQINKFLSKKSFDGAWRVVLIDSVDDLNVASANAILKILEEPPAKSVLLLISHHPNKLLPTVLSRCAKFNLEPLSRQNVATLLRRYMPELNEQDIEKLASISQGSIGKALNYASNNGLKIYQGLQDVIFRGESFDLSQALMLADEASANENVWQLTIELMLGLIFDMVKSGEKTEAFLGAYQDVLKLSNEVSALNMDKKQAFLNMIYLMTKAI